MAQPREFKINVSQSRLHRVQRQAATLYRTTGPYSAYQCLRDNGLEILWPTFLRTAKTWARDRYLREISRYER